MKLFGLIDNSGAIRTTAHVAEGLYEEGGVYGDCVARELPAGTDPNEALALFYWEGEWKVKPPQPSDYHIWNSSEGWVENVDGARDQLLSHLKSASRWGELNLVVEFEGRRFNANLESESNLLSALLTDAFPMDWRDFDEQTTALSADQARTLLNAIRETKLSFRQQYWAIKDRLAAATTIAELGIEDAQEFIDTNGRDRSRGLN